MAELKSALEALAREVKAYDDTLDDAANGGRNARPPDGDDYNALLEIIRRQIPAESGDAEANEEPEASPVTCDACHETYDENDCESTWQQGQCPCCGSWNDRKASDNG
jgi:hypothetical protein